MDHELELKPQIPLEYTITIATVDDTGSLFDNKNLWSSGYLVTLNLNPKYLTASNDQASDPSLLQTEVAWYHIGLISQMSIGSKMVAF